MSGSRYVDQDTLDECSRALRLGATLDFLAGKLGCSPEHLARLLGLLTAPKPTSDPDGSSGLWSVEQSREVL